jgi:hypothetical protein
MVPRLKAMAAAIPLGRRGVPQDIAAMVAFPVSGRAQRISGAGFMAGGGATPDRPRHTPTASSDIHLSPATTEGRTRP